MSSLLDKPDGQPIPGTEKVITAAEQVAALGLKETTVKPASLPLTPAQERRRMSNDWIGDDLDPPDFAAGTVCGPEAVAQALGLRPDDFDSAPLGSQPEGQPITPPGIRPKIEPRPEVVHEAATPPPRATEEEADELRMAYRAHAAKVAAIAEAARGDAAREAAAAAEVRASAALGERLKVQLGGKL